MITYRWRLMTPKRSVQGGQLTSWSIFAGGNRTARLNGPSGYFTKRTL